MSVTRWIVASVASGILAGSVALIAWSGVGIEARAWVAIGILAIALTPLFAGSSSARGWTQPAMQLGAAVAVAALYVVWHGVAARILPTPANSAPDLLRLIWAAGAFALLFVLQTVISVYPNGALAHRLYPWAFGGFHLDELFTRATFLLWPPRHVRRQRATMAAAAAPRALGRAV